MDIQNDIQNDSQNSCKSMGIIKSIFAGAEHNLMARCAAIFKSHPKTFS